MGLAVIRDRELTDCRVKTFKGSWSDSKLRDIVYVLKTYIEDKEITTVTLKKPDVFRTSNGLELLISELKALCQRSKIQMTMLSLRALKENYSLEKGFTKSKMIKEVASGFPELYVDYNKEQRNKNKYYAKMFEAIALARFNRY